MGLFGAPVDVEGGIGLVEVVECDAGEVGCGGDERALGARMLKGGVCEEDEDRGHRRHGAGAAGGQRIGGRRQQSKGWRLDKGGARG